MEKVEVLKVEKEDGEEHKCFLLGTVHLSRVSVDDVRTVINHVKPEAIVVELCRGRKAILHQKAEDIKSGLTLQSIQTNGLFTSLYSAFLASSSKGLDVLPGEDFQAAYEAGRAQDPRPKFILGDRPQGITVSRFWNSLSLFLKAKFCVHMLLGLVRNPSKEEVEKLKEVDEMTRSLKEMGQEFPSLVEVLVYERDLFLTSRIFEATCAYSSVVAVVGAGHVQGICEAWETAEDIDTYELMRLPKKKPFPISFPTCLGILSALTMATVVFKRYRPL